MDPSVPTMKDFAPIRDDYTFFEQHATEAEQDLAAYLPGFRAALTRRLRATESSDDRSAGRCRLLDFGCGPGTFSAKFLRALQCPADRLALTLVEPQPLYLEQARATLGQYSAEPLRDSASLPVDSPRSFDLILSNHVLYYVPDLDTTVLSLVAALAPGGIFQTAIAGQDNVLIRFWFAAFAMLGIAVPYHTAESVAAVLDRHRIPYAAPSVHYRLAFPDSAGNRSRILRFLLGQYYDRLPEAELRRFFDPYAIAGTVTIDTSHTHFIVRGE